MSPPLSQVSFRKGLLFQTASDCSKTWGEKKKKWVTIQPLHVFISKSSRVSHLICFRFLSSPLKTLPLLLICQHILSWREQNHLHNAMKDSLTWHHFGCLSEGSDFESIYCSWSRSVFGSQHSGLVGQK